VAHDAQAALARVDAARPHVVILDIGLPGMDGYALIERLRATEAAGRASFVALTGYGGEEDRQRAHAAGFWRHFTKPAPSDLLLACLQEAAEKSDCHAAQE
jgi:CheY-like chemotaxis protein